MPFTFNPITGELDIILGTGTLDNTYLRLDCSNDPLTGALDLTPSSDIIPLNITAFATQTANLVNITALSGRGMSVDKNGFVVIGIAGSPRAGCFLDINGGGNDTIVCIDGDAGAGIDFYTNGACKFKFIQDGGQKWQWGSDASNDFYINDNAANVWKINQTTNQFTFPKCTSLTASINLGGDVDLYRLAADTLATPDLLRIGGVTSATDVKVAIHSDGTPFNGLNISESDADSGMYLTSRTDDEVMILGGAKLTVAGAFEARATEASIYLQVNGTHFWYGNTSQTAGVNYTPTLRGSLTNLGQFQLPISGSNAGILLGGDVQLYRSAANVLTIPDSVTITGDLTHEGTNIGFYSTTPVAQSSAYTVTNEVATRTIDTDLTTLNEVADVLGTLIEDLKLTGIIG